MIQVDLTYGAYPSSKLDLYHAGDDAPLFIFFHGGGIAKGSKADGKSERFIELMNSGISVADANYRMYPDAKFPDFLEDAAECVAWCKKNVPHGKTFIGGSSAGGYMTMMLAFDEKYLGAYGINAYNEDDIAGYFCDSGQPTAHFNVMKFMGEDSRLIRVDERAPIYFVREMENKEKLPRYALIVSDDDMYNRLEQNQLLYRTMMHMKFPEENVSFTLMKGYKHTKYGPVQKEDGRWLYAEMIRNFIDNKLPLTVQE